MGKFKLMAPKSRSSWQYVYVNTPVEQNKSLGLDVKHRELVTARTIESSQGKSSKFCNIKMRREKT